MKKSFCLFPIAAPGQCDPGKEWECADGRRCIDARRLCDGYVDCADLSDEDTEMCPKGEWGRKSSNLWKKVSLSLTWLEVGKTQLLRGGEGGILVLRMRHACRLTHNRASRLKHLWSRGENNCGWHSPVSATLANFFFGTKRAHR